MNCMFCAMLHLLTTTASCSVANSSHSSIIAAEPVCGATFSCLQAVAICCRGVALSVCPAVDECFELSWR